jgi:hypothetical protein
MIVRPRVLSGDYVWGLGSFSSSAGNFNEVGDRAAGKKMIVLLLTKSDAIMSGEFSMKAGGGRGPKAPTADRLVFSQRVYACMCVCVC